FPQLVQKPSLLSFQVPSPFMPSARLTGSRVILPSGVNTILNLMFDGVEDVNGSPLKKASWISFGVSLVTASAPEPVHRRTPAASPALHVRMMGSPDEWMGSKSYYKSPPPPQGFTPARASDRGTRA